MASYNFKNSLLLFLLFSFHVITTVHSLTHSTATLCHDHDRSALLHFKQSLSLNESASADSSAYSKTESWKAKGENTTDCCSWHGVECEDKTGYIIGLHLSSSFLYGTLHSNSTIFSLVHLQTLNLADNNFRNSEIPSEISRLSSLSRLDLSFSVFSGPIPTKLSRLFKLSYLDLSDNDFNGIFPVNIFHLPSMLFLYIGGNQNLTGFLPEFNQTSYFKELILSFTNFSGNLPLSIGKLQSLTILELAQCYFSGYIPASVGNMTHLIKLSLFDNELTGPIPSSFSQLKNLEYLDLSRNNLIGTVEADIFLSHRKLIFLSLSSNNITLLADHHQINFTIPTLRVLQLNGCNLRKIPNFLKFHNNLEILFLSENNIRGKIPHWIWNISDHLESIYLSRNFLTSMEHNQTFVSSTSLRVIDISSNMLQGNLPVPPPNAIKYSVSNNSLSGDIPPLICSGMSLEILDLSYNSMSGPIPQCLSNSLASFNLQSNKFSGTIPQVYSEACKLKEIDLSQNQLMGEVPKSWSNCKLLQILDLSDNWIEQTFPIWLGTLPRLQVLFLHSNKIHGAMGSPRSPLEFPMLRIIDVSHNSLAGNLPVEYIQIWNAMKVYRPDKELYIRTDVNFETQTSHWGSPYQQGSITLINKGVKMEYEMISNILTAIDLSSNNFTGEIPESVGSLKGLGLLNLSNNELTGPIPQSLANLTNLEALDLSQNWFTGVIPQKIASQLSFLAFFNVSYNRLSGHIPRGSQFDTFDNSSYVGNQELCGFPLSKNCGTVHSPPADNEEDDSDDIYEFLSNFNWMFILAGLGSGLVVGFIMGNILTDRYSWLISWIVRSSGLREKNRRRWKRPIIRK